MKQSKKIKARQDKRVALWLSAAGDATGEKDKLMRPSGMNYHKPGSQNGRKH